MEPMLMVVVLVGWALTQRGWGRAQDILGGDRVGLVIQAG